MVRSLWPATDLPWHQGELTLQKYSIRAAHCWFYGFRTPTSDAWGRIDVQLTESPENSTVEAETWTVYVEECILKCYLVFIKIAFFKLSSVEGLNTKNRAFFEPSRRSREKSKKYSTMTRGQDLQPICPPKSSAWWSGICMTIGLQKTILLILPHASPRFHKSRKEYLLYLFRLPSRSYYLAIDMLFLKLFVPGFGTHVVTSWSSQKVLELKWSTPPTLFPKGSKPCKRIVHEIMEDAPVDFSRLWMFHRHDSCRWKMTQSLIQYQFDQLVFVGKACAWMITSDQLLDFFCSWSLPSVHG